MLDRQGVQLGAGIIQIRAYSEEAADKKLVADWTTVSELLNAAKSEFNDLLISTNGINYFGIRKKHVTSAHSALPLATPRHSVRKVQGAH